MAQKFKKAKFRNVEFFLAEGSTNFGRRNVVHEYPQRDEPFSEDLGRKAREFQVEAYIIGDDVDAQRDKLIDAAETSGPGILVHPYYGERNVVVESCSIKETCAENRIVRVTLTFKEAGKALQPLATADSAFQVGLAADALSVAAGGDFDSAFSVLKKAQFVVDSAADKIRSVASTVKKYSGTAAGVYKAAANLAFAIQHLDQNVLQFLNSPTKMRIQIEAAFQLLSDTFVKVSGGSRDAFGAHARLLGYGSDDVVSGTATPSRVAQDKNRVAVNNLVKRNAVANAAKEAVNLSFTSVEDAKAIRSTLLDSIDDLSLDANDTVFVALQDLSSAINAAIPKPGEALPQIVSVTTDQVESSLVMTYRLYGNLDRESDLISRNLISHPGFISKGTEIQVLGNG